MSNGREAVCMADDKEELTEEELQELFRSYKKELAHIYRTSAAKKADMCRRDPQIQNALLQDCDEDMRRNITDLKKKYGIRY